MARRRTSRSTAGRQVSPPFLSPSSRWFIPLRPLFHAPVVLREYEDRRTFHPSRALRPAFSFERSASRQIVRNAPSDVLRRNISARIGFAVPRKVAVCIRRKQRKEVLHANKFFGKGSGGVSRRHIWNALSRVDC